MPAIQGERVYWTPRQPSDCDLTGIKHATPLRQGQSGACDSNDDAPLAMRADAVRPIECKRIGVAARGSGFRSERMWVQGRRGGGPLEPAGMGLPRNATFAGQSRFPARRLQTNTFLR